MAVTMTATAAAGAWESGVRSSYGYAVPSRFLWLADLATPCAAFVLARLLAPVLQTLVSPGGILYSPAFARFSLPGGPGGLNPLDDVLWILPVMVSATLVSMELLGGYRQLLEQSWTRVLASSIGAPLVALSAVSLILITLKLEQISRAFVFSLAALTAVAFVGYRSLLRHYKRRRLAAGDFARNVVVVGSPSAVAWMHGHFTNEVSADFFRLRGYLSLPGDSAALPPSGVGVSIGSPAPECLGSVADLGNLLVHLPIHEVVAVESATSAGWLGDVLEACEYFRVTVRIVPQELLEWRDRSGPVLFRSGPLRLPEIVLKAPHFDSNALFVKRLIDILVSGTLLVFLSPLFLLIALAIKLTTPGLTVLYPWRVVGYKGRQFTGYKFTTMQADADERKAELMHLNEMSGPVFKIRDDPRITALGRFLRKFSLNELPQLWSVLKGDMSLVGPRPANPKELARYELWQKRKLCVQPGITCLWQIRGRNAISNFDDWVRMDFEYIDNWSLWLDCVILGRTVWEVVKGSGS